MPPRGRPKKALQDFADLLKKEEDHLGEMLTIDGDSNDSNDKIFEIPAEKLNKDDPVKKAALMKKINSYKMLFPEETKDVHIDETDIASVERSLTILKCKIDGRECTDIVQAGGSMIDKGLTEGYKFAMTPLENIISSMLINCNGFAGDVSKSKEVHSLTKKIVIERDLLPMIPVPSSGGTSDIGSLLFVIAKIFFMSIMKNSCMKQLDANLDKELKDKYKDI